MDIVNLFSKDGGIITRWITGLIVGGIVAFLAHFGFQLSPEKNAELFTVVCLLVTNFISDWINKKQSNNIKIIQEQVQKTNPEVDIDGHAGNVTLNAISEILNK